MNKAEYEIHDVKADGNVVRFVRKKKPEKLDNLFERAGMYD